MASIIGQLLVELGVNTAAFKSGLDKATYEAKVFGEKLKEGFAGVKDAVAELAGEFGGLSPAISGAMRGIMSAVGPLTGALGGVGGALAALGIVGAATGVAVIGLAAHAAETAEKLYSLSQATGVSVETLSGLSQVAKINGIEVEQLAKGLERMGKSAFAAAEAGPKTKNAYRELGIEVRDASGHMRDQADIFEDVATKFSTMQNGAEKTALAMQIFGKSGADLIPVLNRGGEEIAQLVGHFQKLGAIMDTDTAAASEKIAEDFTLMKAAFQGVENRILVGLTPAITEFLNEVVSGLEDSQSSISVFVEGLVDVAKVIINIFQVVGEVLRLTAQQFRLFGEAATHLFSGLSNAFEDLKSGDFKGALRALGQEGILAFKGLEQGAQEAWNSIKETAGNIEKVWTASTPKAPQRKQGKDTSPGPMVDVDFVRQGVAAIQNQAKHEEELAQSIGKVSQATIEADAAAQADLELGKLREEAIKKHIENTKAFRDAMQNAVPAIEAASLKLAVFKAALATQTEFDNFNKRIQQQISALEEANMVGSVSEKQWAKNNAALIPLKDSLAALTEEYKKLSAEKNPLAGELEPKIASLAKQLEKATAETNRLNEAFQQSKANEEAKKLDDQIAKLNIDLMAMKGGDAFLNVDEQVKLLGKDLGLTGAQLDILRGKMEEIRKLQVEQALAKKENALGFDPVAIKTISLEIQQLKSDWETGKIGQDEYETTLKSLIKEQADLQAKTGGFTSGVRAAFADVAASSQSLGQTMHDVIGKGIQGIEDNFAQMVTTGKASWQSLIDSMEQMLIKSAINTLISKLLGSLTGLLGGGGASAGGGFGSIFGSLFGGHKAAGGDVSPGKAYLVGENGPELFSPAATGSIIPNNAISSSSRPVMINQTFNVQAQDANSFRESQTQIANKGYAAAQAAMRRNG